MKRSLIAVCLVVLFSPRANAARKEPFFLRDAVGVKTYAAAPRLAQRASMVAASALPAAEATMPEEIVAIREWNAAGRTPARNGFKRTLPDLIELKGSALAAAKTGVSSAGRGIATRTDHGTIIWSTVVKVDNAYGLRLHLEHCVLPEGAVLWVYGAGEEPTAFGRELLDDNASLWTPSTQGETVWLDVEAPSPAPVSFTIREIVQILDLGSPHAEDLPTCLIDSSCVSPSTFDSLNIAHSAVAQLQYVKTDGSYICSGGLLNDTKDSGTPYLLTANHCFSTQTEASSLDAYFDYISPSCNGVVSRSSAKKVHGAQLLASSATSDFTLVKLNSIPAGRGFLGWDTNPPANGAKLYRLSHPQPDDGLRPQMYSSTSVNTAASTCTGKSRPDFIYSSFVEGGTYGGSSGSPVIIAGGYVVGQLLGYCGPVPEAGCDNRNRVIDGAFATTFNSVAQWLDPTSTVCTQNATTLCLAGNRFAVSSTWQTGDGKSGSGQAVRLTDDTGYFWFFGSSNVEVVLKVLNACGLNSKYWVFAGGLTDVSVTLSVVDTKTGTPKTYINPLGKAFQPIQDTSAFATCP